MQGPLCPVGRVVVMIGFEPMKWRSQSPLPYRLATSQYIDKIGGELSYLI